MALRGLCWFGGVLLALGCGPSGKGSNGDGAAASAGAAGAGGASGMSSAGTTAGGQAGSGAGGTSGAVGTSGASGMSSAGSAGGPDFGPIIEPGDPGKADLTFTIRADRDVHAISPWIYGVNGGALSCSDAVARPTLCRIGGNRWTNYNWETNASNAGSDYCFQNDSLLGNTNTPGRAVTDVVNEARGAGAATVVTVPIVDYVSADKMGGSAPPDCSGDVRKSGADYLATRFKRNQPRKGSAFSSTPDAADGTVSQDEFAAFVKASAGSARILFSLDNEPDLWSSTHAQAHPNPVTYDELVTRNIDYSTALRAVFPEARILGFVSYGFSGYVNLQDAPDRDGKGEFVDYYLSRMRAAETQAGMRLIDYLDLHWYPEARGGGARITENVTSAAAVEARVQAPRSLWDPGYREESWILDYTGGPIRLIPWLKQKIAVHYPGTELAFTEWNYGAGGHISGAIATADVLGVFGREGVAIAALWSLAQNESFHRAAFAAYRNYDGGGATFGDTSIQATSSDEARASVYASVDRDNPDRVVIVAINRGATALTAAITLAHSSEFATATVHTLTAAAAELRSAAAIAAVATNAFRYSMPPQSVSVLVPQR